MTNDLQQYNTLAAEWWNPSGPFALLHELVPTRFQFFDTFIPRWDGLKIADVGCGGGFVSEFLSKRGATVFGFDIAQNLLEIANSHAKLGNCEVTYQHASAYELPLKDNSLDAVVCVDVLEHLEYVPKALNEFFRVLKPGGHFLFDTINRTLISKILSVFVMENIIQKIPKGTHDWSMFVKPSEISEMLSNAGFREIKLQGTQTSLNPFHPKISLGRSMSMLYLGACHKPQN